MASKFLSKLQQRPLLLVVVLAIAALAGGHAGGHHGGFGLWDGPI